MDRVEELARKLYEEHQGWEVGDDDEIAQALRTYGQEVREATIEECARVASKQYVAGGGDAGYELREDIADAIRSLLTRHNKTGG